MIVLVGATGRLGIAVATRFLRNGTPFRAACRNVDKAQWLAEKGVEVVPLDLISGAGIAEAVLGASQVISCVHGLLGRSSRSIEQIDVIGHASLIDACGKADVQRFVYVSALGASPTHPSEFWRAKARTEEALKASGLEYVILRPSAFMDLCAHDMIGAAVLRGKRVVLLGSGRTPRNMIAVADVADAAMIALSKSELAGSTLEIGGYDNPTDREVAAMYAALSGRTPKIYSIPPFALKILAAAVSPFHAGVGHLLRLPIQLEGRNDLRLDGSSEIEQLGIRPVRLITYADGRKRSDKARTQ